MENKTPRLITTLPFRDDKVNVFYHPDMDDNESFKKFNICWRARNPGSFYTGMLFLNHSTGKIEYPEGAIIPEQTPSDREIIPNFVIVGVHELDEPMIEGICAQFESGFARRNKIS